MAFSLQVYSPTTRSTQIYTRKGDGTAVDGYAYITDDLAAVLFSDGTFYYSGDNSGGKTQISKLPSLSAGYVYTNFVISGKSLLTSWEEQTVLRDRTGGSSGNDPSRCAIITGSMIKRFVPSIAIALILSLAPSNVWAEYSTLEFFRRFQSDL